MAVSPAAAAGSLRARDRARASEAHARAEVAAPCSLRPPRRWGGVGAKQNWAFGSLVNGNVHPGSDRDVAVLGLSRETWASALGRLSQLVPGGGGPRADRRGEPFLRRPNPLRRQGALNARIQRLRADTAADQQALSRQIAVLRRTDPPTSGDEASLALVAWSLHHAARPPWIPSRGSSRLRSGAERGGLTRLRAGLLVADLALDANVQAFDAWLGQLARASD